ncbi:echinoidin-like [Patiria miniata]|uniref:C-type lectin domain-containing protein n=1 Tax=Patiria miniata TaxID=46514 RepID=A0A914AMV6_PATMI|nr:echinoidin-like [Patiria miniata]
MRECTSGVNLHRALDILSGIQENQIQAAAATIVFTVIGLTGGHGAPILAMLIGTLCANSRNRNYKAVRSTRTSKIKTFWSGRAEHCIPCPKLWVAFDGDCYRLVTEKLPWVEAEKYCRELSNSDWFPSHLVSINSLEEQQFIVELLKASYPLEKLPSVKAWLGYNDMERETRFVWSASSGANFTRWARNQPDNGGGKGQDCVAIIQENNWKWDDMTCRFGRHFICELKMLNGRQ